jgi:hypothetical protein
MVREVLAFPDAYAAHDLLVHIASHVTEAGRQTLTKIIDIARLHQRTIPADLLKNLTAALNISQVLPEKTRWDRNRD